MFENDEKYSSQIEGSRRSQPLDYARGRQSKGGSDGFFCRFTFGQFFALLVLEVFTIFFVFYLGARFGPKLLGLEGKGPVVVGETTKKVLTTDDPEVSAMAQEIVSQAKTPELKERLAAMLKKDTSSQPSAQNEVPPREVVEQDKPQLTEEQPPVEQMQVASKGQEDQQVTMRQADTTGEVERGAVRIKAAENAKYALQIGSYQQMDEANAAIQKWKNKGYPAYMMIADIPDRGRWYRVRLGGFASRAEANAYKKQFETQESVETIVVMNEQ